MAKKPLDPAKLAPQAKLIYDFLMAGRILSSLIGMANLNVGDIRTRVSELRKAGLEITDRWSRDHYLGRRYKQYWVKSAVEAREAAFNKEQ